jgi:hypothetical protein
MASLKDWLNKCVISIEGYDDLCCISILHQESAKDQRDEFGQLQEVVGKLEAYDISLDFGQLNDFLSKARSWLELPLSDLVNCYFQGEWRFVQNEEGYFHISFDKHSSTPSKTDWFTVEVSANLRQFSYERSIHVDRSGLQNFVDGLKNET